MKFFKSGGIYQIFSNHLNNHSNDNGSSVTERHFKKLEIVRLLPVYKEEFVFMSSATLFKNTLTCWFDSFSYPYYKTPINHLTRDHVLFFLTQSCYLGSAVLSMHDPRWPIDIASALSLAEDERMLFTDIHIQFRNLIANNDGIELLLNIDNYRLIRGSVYANLSFEFPDGCYGTCDAIIALDNPLPNS